MTNHAHGQNTEYAHAAIEDYDMTNFITELP